MVTRIVILLGLSGLALAGCGTLSDDRQTFDGVAFRASLSADKEDKRNFSVEVRDAAKSLAGAREAGRYEAVQHCIENFGNSRMSWSQGPDVEDADLQVADGDLILKGQCAGW
ncbi:hypothetical protein SAMN05216196_101392 [Lutimaribacter pacificus]|uniref:Lipoprotein n=1 Tax=Lutimaribacter pacificus TaxID=391948 RepID=A0A1H0B0T6_9RHOB|nr:hypothetical protein [Lutimaribacter pacificus]SDN39280.1 hypothetical protein SAMN05216196_101392 [Lutimaribacter pacificus]SHJ61867.1 hypothetical protein SAMN05444142_101825 [Lutimaribacter pacificus]